GQQSLSRPRSSSLSAATTGPRTVSQRSTGHLGGTLSGVGQRRLREPRHLSWKESMRSRLVMLLACVIAAVAVAASLVVSSRTQLPAAHASLPTSSASYLGVYETGPPHAYQPVADFTKVVGNSPTSSATTAAGGARGGALPNIVR